jgi:hypothetical protein
MTKGFINILNNKLHYQFFLNVFWCSNAIIIQIQTYLFIPNYSYKMEFTLQRHKSTNVITIKSIFHKKEFSLMNMNPMFIKEKLLKTKMNIH